MCLREHLKIASDLDDFHQIIIIQNTRFQVKWFQVKISSIVPPNILARVLEMKCAHALHSGQEISEERKKAGWWPQDIQHQP